MLFLCIYDHHWCWCCRRRHPETHTILYTCLNNFIIFFLFQVEITFAFQLIIMLPASSLSHSLTEPFTFFNVLQHISDFAFLIIFFLSARFQCLFHKKLNLWYEIEMNIMWCCCTGSPFLLSMTLARYGRMKANDLMQCDIFKCEKFKLKWEEENIS